MDAGNAHHGITQLTLVCSSPSLMKVTVGFDPFSEDEATEATLGPVTTRPHSLLHLNIKSGIVFFLLVSPNLQFLEKASQALLNLQERTNYSEARRKSLFHRDLLSSHHIWHTLPPPSDEPWGLDADLWKWLSGSSICLPKQVLGLCWHSGLRRATAMQLFAFSPAVLSLRKATFSNPPFSMTFLNCFLHAVVSDKVMLFMWRAEGMGLLTLHSAWNQNRLYFGKCRDSQLTRFCLLAWGWSFISSKYAGDLILQLQLKTWQAIAVSTLFSFAWKFPKFETEKSWRKWSVRNRIQRGLWRQLSCKVLVLQEWGWELDLQSQFFKNPGITSHACNLSP